MDGVAPEACDMGYTPTEIHGGFQWDSGLPYQGDLDESLLPSSNSSSDDDPEDMVIIECEQDVEGATSGENKILDQPKENVDNFTESYESASSDMMETPAEDSQELAKIYGSNDMEDSPFCSRKEAKEESPQEEAEEASLKEEAMEASHQEEAMESSHQEEAMESSHQEEAKEASHQEEAKEASHQEEAEEASRQEEAEDASQQEEAEKASHQDFEKFDEVGNAAGIDEIVEDSSTDTDEEHSAKRRRLTAPGDGEIELVTSLSKEVQV